MIETVAFDADDTLWESELFFSRAKEQMTKLLQTHVSADQFSHRLLSTQLKNLERYGVGIKGFILSAVEAALELTNRTLPGALTYEIIKIGQSLIEHPVSFCPKAESTIARLCGQYRLLLITKGDLRDQHRKVALSGLADFFDGVEIVPEKDQQTYRMIFSKYDAEPARTMMIGNSLKSDVIPALDAGAWATYVPHPLTWAGEQHREPNEHDRYIRADSLLDVPRLIENVVARKEY